MDNAAQVVGDVSQVESPCIKVCTLNGEQICIGCGRTVAEIAIWSRAEEYQRQSIRDAAHRRKLAMGAGPEAGGLSTAVG